MPGRTLRRRITLILVVVLMVAGVVIGVATAVFLRGFLVSRLDSQLVEAGGRYAVSLEYDDDAGGSDDDADNAPAGQSVGTLGVRMVAGSVAQAAVVQENGTNAPISLDAEATRLLDALPVGGAARSVDLDGLDDYRVLAVAGRDGDVQITGLPLHPVTETVARLLLIEAVLISGAVLLAAGAVSLAVGRTLSPLRQVAERAGEVSAMDLVDAATPMPAGLSPRHPTTEVDQVSVAFDHMLGHVHRALLAREATEARLRRFIADASHELRTPLATIRAYAEYPARTGEDLPPSALTALERIDASATRMSVLVDDLLLLARLDAGRPLAVEDVDLTLLALEAVDDAQAAGPGHRWHLDLPEEPVHVDGDAARLHQVVANLLTNARTHTPEGTTVTLALRAGREYVELDVCDDGPGVPADLQADLFDRFTRGDQARTSLHTGDGGGVPSGTGLGLAIAQGITAAHRGTLTLDSRPGRTIFTLRLPAPATT